MTFKSLKEVPNAEKAAMKLVDGVINGQIKRPEELHKVAALTKHKEILTATLGFQVALALVS